MAKMIPENVDQFTTEGERQTYRLDSEYLSCRLWIAHDHFRRQG